MERIYSYKGYQALQAVNEAIDEFIDQVEPDQAVQIQDLVDQQDEIFKRYDLDQTEIDNIKNGVEDSIRYKLGMNTDSE